MMVARPGRFQMTQFGWLDTDGDGIADIDPNELDIDGDGVTDTLNISWLEFRYSRA